MVVLVVLSNTGYKSLGLRTRPWDESDALQLRTIING